MYEFRLHVFNMRLIQAFNYAQFQVIFSNIPTQSVIINVAVADYY